MNGRPPREEDYLALAGARFKDYVLPVGGLVERPLRLTLEDLRRLPRQAQITKHNCIQGWSGVAEWAGVPLREIIRRCRPLPAAGDVVFWAFDEKSRSEPHFKAPGQYYGTIPMAMALQPQTLLAYDMNGEPLAIEHGAPLRLRLETQYRLHHGEVHQGHRVRGELPEGGQGPGRLAGGQPPPQPGGQHLTGGRLQSPPYWRRRRSPWRARSWVRSWVTSRVPR